MDGSLFDALSGKTIKDANFNNWINGLENSEKAAMSAGTALDKYKNSLQQTSSVGAKAGAIFKSLGATLLSMAALTAISFAIEKVGEGISYAINYSKNLSDSAKTAGAAFSQTSSDIDSYKDKITELQGVLTDHSSTVEEVTSAKSQLLDIQGQLTEKYGSEASGIDLVNGSLEQQLNLLDSIKESEYYKQKASVDKKNVWDWIGDRLSKVKSWISGDKNDSNFGVSKTDQIIRDYQNYQGRIAASNSKEINNLMKQLGFKEVKNKNTLSGDKLVGFDFDGNVEDIIDNFDKINERLLALQKSGKISTEDMNAFKQSLEQVSSEAKTFQASNKDYYDSSMYYNNIYGNNDLKNVYDNLAAEREKYQKALTSGDKQALNQSLQNYKNYFNQISSLTDDTEVQNWMKDLYSDMNEALAKSNLKEDIQKNVSDVMDIVNAISKESMGKMESQMLDSSNVDSLIDKYKDLGLTAQDVIDVLKDVGVIQSDQYKQLYAKFDDKLKTLTKEQLEIGYTIENYGDMDFDQFNAKIEESQRIASNEIDIKSRTNLDNYNTAKEGGSQSDDYDSYVAMMKAGKELAAEGKKGTEEFKAAARAFSENGMDDIDDWNENLAYLGKYFTEDASGAQAFIDTLKGMTYADGKTPFAKLNEDGETYTLNLQDMQYMAEQLHMPLEMLSVLLQNLQSYGFSDSYFGTMEDGLD